MICCKKNNLSWRKRNANKKWQLHRVDCSPGPVNSLIDNAINGEHYCLMVSAGGGTHLIWLQRQSDGLWFKLINSPPKQKEALTSKKSASWLREIGMGEGRCQIGNQKLSGLVTDSQLEGKGERGNTDQQGPIRGRTGIMRWAAKPKKTKKRKKKPLEWTWNTIWVFRPENGLASLEIDNIMLFSHSLPFPFMSSID